jgi:hypothetical protein
MSARIAAAARMALWAHIAADENVAFEFRHGSMVQERCYVPASSGYFLVVSSLRISRSPDDSEKEPATSR